MSVINFEARELGNIVAVLLREVGHREAQEWRAKYSEALATISKANTACFAYRYEGRGVAATAEQITTAALSQGTGNLDNAISTVQLLQYNCREDKNYIAEVEGGFEALALVLNDLFSMVVSRALAAVGELR